ncbi:MAG: nitric oxide reductase NorD protein, partial [Hyphomicrobiales bacterium]
MSPSSARLRLIETPADRAVTRLHRLVRQRDVLRADFRTAWDSIAADCADAELEAWAAAAIELAFVNAGPPCLLAFWRVSIALRASFGLSVPTAFGHACAEVCRHAGAAAALACLQAGGAAARQLGSARELAQWSRGLERLAREAPESVAAVASRTETILHYCDGAAFESFIATGLKAGGQDRTRRRAFFALDALARQTLERAAGVLGFAQLERQLKAFATALWGRPPILRAIEPIAGHSRRAGISGGIIRVPAVFRGVSGEAAAQLFKACIAHATAHLALTPARFPVGQLKPLQIVLTGLIEDARVEALALRRFPGLRRVWAPFHVAVPSGPATAPALLARLARALFDPDYADDNGFVAKGRALFAAEAARLEDPALSRRVGGLLGNDLGQMRVQFNARTYVVEPVYRDDGLGLWDIDDPAPPEAEILELQVEAVRMTRQENP